MKGQLDVAFCNFDKNRKLIIDQFEENDETVV